MATEKPQTPKVLFVGNAVTGKTTCARELRYPGSALGGHAAGIFVEAYSVTRPEGGVIYTIWDCAGQRSFGGIGGRSFYKVMKADVAVVFCDDEDAGGWRTPDQWELVVHENSPDAKILYVLAHPDPEEVHRLIAAALGLSPADAARPAAPGAILDAAVDAVSVASARDAAIAAHEATFADSDEAAAFIDTLDAATADAYATAEAARDTLDAVVRDTLDAAVLDAAVDAAKAATPEAALVASLAAANAVAPNDALAAASARIAAFAARDSAIAARDAARGPLPCAACGARVCSVCLCLPPGGQQSLSGCVVCERLCCDSCCLYLGNTICVECAGKQVPMTIDEIRKLMQL